MLPKGDELARRLALGAGLITVTLWASAFVGIRAASRVFSPEALALGRLTIASIALGLVVLIRREPLPSKRDLPGIAMVSLLWFPLYNVTLMEAERRVDAGTAAMLVNLGPILIAVLAGMLLAEGFPGRLFAGIAVAFAGAVVIGIATARHGFEPSWGALLCVAAALFYAGAVVAQKPLLSRLSPLQITWVACTLGAIVCLPFSGILVSQLPHAQVSTVGWMLYLAIGPMAIGFLTWGYALSRASAGQAAALNYLITPVAVVLGWLLLGEVPPLLALGGGALTLVGVWLARRSPAPRVRTTETDRAVASG